MFENGRTQESFECRSEFIPPGSTESVNITCCSKIKLGENNKDLVERNTTKHSGYVLQIRHTPVTLLVINSVRLCITKITIAFETCGPNCFAFIIVQPEETDYGEYYITLTKDYSDTPGKEARTELDHTRK